MPDYFLKFEGDLGDLLITVYHREWDDDSRFWDSQYVEIISVKRKGKEIRLNPQKRRRVFKCIKNGTMKMTYLGGYCSSGSAWGPERITGNLALIDETLYKKVASYVI